MLSRDVTARVNGEAELRRTVHELQRFNSASVGRELRMIELKREVNRLSRELGRAAPFDPDSLEAAAPAASRVPA
ncbi:MAG: hypothetical protein JNM90_20930 [Burkholderiales bacterium]|nr:hypothetical protein [Burkholderiales bacterium]